VQHADIRHARTEALFRDVNERIAETAERFSSDATEFVCECSDASCAERIETSLETYDEVREDGTQFIVVPGHEDDGIERIVEKRPRYNIVAKVRNRVVADVVRRLNPRTAET
jgi:hypothetical protein